MSKPEPESRSPSLDTARGGTMAVYRAMKAALLEDPDLSDDQVLESAGGHRVFDRELVLSARRDLEAEKASAHRDVEVLWSGGGFHEP